MNAVNVAVNAVNVAVNAVNVAVNAVKFAATTANVVTPRNARSLKEISTASATNIVNVAEESFASSPIFEQTRVNKSHNIFSLYLLSLLFIEISNVLKETKLTEKEVEHATPPTSVLSSLVNNARPDRESAATILVSS